MLYVQKNRSQKGFLVYALEKICQTWRSGKYFLKRSWFGKMWITKKDIYPTFDQPPEAENHLYNHVFIT